jgi:hypothetical protein
MLCGTSERFPVSGLIHLLICTNTGVLEAGTTNSGDLYALEPPLPSLTQLSVRSNYSLEGKAPTV